ncbi:MAG: hypothetical protein P1V36_05800, partial [Planctomycetota bacterium]|nr:hypothetical protein [Planctomycetota bacterium]
MPHRPTRSICSALALASVLLLTACGGGAAAPTDAPAPAVTPNLTATTVVITADVDLDGVNDVLEIPLDTVPGPTRPTDTLPEGEDDSPRPRCWHGRADGTFSEALPAEALPGLDRIRDDLQRRPDHDILADEGAHQATGDGDTLPYAVLHLERADDAATDAPADPVLDGTWPERGRVGSLVGLRGSDLAARDETTTVRFDDLDARVLLALPHFVLTVVPERAPLGRVDVVLARDRATSAAVPFTVVERPTPTLTSVQPDPAVPGVLAVLRGEDLGSGGDDVGVTFGGVAARRVLALGKLVFAEVPADALSGLVIVTVDGVASNGVQTEIAGRLDAPTLRDVSPAAASAGSLVRITGDDLFVIGEAPHVRFGRKPATLFGRERDALIVIVPSEADGDITVRLGDRTSEGLPFELARRGEPVLDRLNPTSGAPGEAIDILGTDLHDLGG